MWVRSLFSTRFLLWSQVKSSQQPAPVMLFLLPACLLVQSGLTHYSISPVPVQKEPLLSSLHRLFLFFYFKCWWKLKPRWFSAWHSVEIRYEITCLLMMCQENDTLTAKPSTGSANVEITALHYMQYVFYRTATLHPERRNWNPSVLSQSFNPREQWLQNGSETHAWSWFCCEIHVWAINWHQTCRDLERH